MRFFITGLPRSRTAWLATLADMVPNAVCHHEPTTWFDRWQDVETIWGESEAGHVGISDSCLGFRLGDILDHYGPRVLVVARPMEEVAASLEAIGLPVAHKALAILWGRIHPYLDDPLVRVVPYDALYDEVTVFSCLKHLMPDAHIDPAKVGRMMSMNVQADTTFTMARAKGKDVTRLLGPEITAALH